MRRMIIFINVGSLFSQLLVVIKVCPLSNKCPQAIKKCSKIILRRGTDCLLSPAGGGVLGDNFARGLGGILFCLMDYC